MNLFRVRGIRLAIHFSFFLLLAFVAYQGWVEAGAEGLFWNVVTIVAFFTCVVLHEFGHCFTAMHFGHRVRRILLMPIGGMAEFETLPRQPSRELLITLAGPAVNFAIVGVIWIFVGAPPGLPFNVDDLPANAIGFAHLLLAWNLMMGLFNLLPAFPMDGGRILRALLAIRLPFLRATFLASLIGKIVAFAVIIYLTIGMVLDNLYGVGSHSSNTGQILAICLFMFITFAGELEYRAVLRREREDAHWRAMLARMYVTPPAAEEPPLFR